MALNKPNGNMYPWAWTWNPLGGACPHQCSYCSTNSLKKAYRVLDKKYSGDVFLVEKELKTPLKKPNDGKVIFVCNMTDLFADKVPEEYIIKIMKYCGSYPKNTYLFQSKNPKRFWDFEEYFIDSCIFGTTLETNRDIIDTLAPKPSARVPWVWEFSDRKYSDRFSTMISIEPIVDFDFWPFILSIRNCCPDFVSIGADSKNNGLPEPSSEKIKGLIFALSKFTEVKVKSNLSRLTKVHDTKERVE